jgi:hypothetical protein
MSVHQKRESWAWRWSRAVAVVGAGVLGWSLAATSTARVADDDKPRPPAPATRAPGSSPSPAPPSPALPAGRALTSLDEAVVIGASVSDGFGTLITPPPGPTGTPDRVVMVQLADILAAAVNRPAPLPASTSSFFFQTPERTAEQQLAFAKLHTPKLVFALDYLFWHAYGSMPEAERLKALERGLARLDQLHVPIVIADLPDMSHAVGLMLGPSQIPSKETLAKLNERIAEWARSRKDVIVLPMTGVVADAIANKAVTLGGHEYPAGESRALLTGEGLHATGDGEIAVSLEALDRLIAAGVLDKSVTVERNPDVIKGRLLAMKAKSASPTAPTTPSTPTPPPPLGATPGKPTGPKSTPKPEQGVRPPGTPPK